MEPVQQLTSLLGSRHPVLLAPMAGISGGRLARAVGEAGGFGLVGGGYGDAAWLKEELALCQGSPFGIGFITWSLQRQPALLAQALQAGARAVMLSFGDVEPFVAQVRDAGAVLIAQVQTVEQARQARRAGAQVIVAQGGEGGGHSGVRGTMALVPAVCDAVDVPVVAAGGIADGRGLAAALALGAAGVLAGTVFYAARESLANGRAKDRLVQASGDDTVKSDVVDVVRGLQWPAGPWGLRTLKNGFTDRWHGRTDALRQDGPQWREAYEAARQRGDFDVAAVIAGEAADLVRSVRPAREIVDGMVAEAGAILGRLPGVLRQ